MDERRIIRIGVAVILMAVGAAWWIINMPAAVVATIVLFIGAVMLRWTMLG